jgi:hypothetical protein
MIKLKFEGGTFRFELGDKAIYTCAANNIFEAKKMFLNQIESEIDTQINDCMIGKNMNES